jgi:hypothetical protein
MLHNIIERRILLGKRQVSHPNILPEPHTCSIPYFELSSFKEVILNMHEPFPKG